MRKLLALCLALAMTTASSLIFSFPVRDDIAARNLQYADPGNQIVPVQYLKGDGKSWLYIPQTVSLYPANAPTVELQFICPCKSANSPVFNMYYGSRVFCVGRNSNAKRFTVAFGNATPYTRESDYDAVHTLEVSPSENYVVEDGVEYSLGTNNLNENIDAFVFFARYNSHTKAIDGINDSAIYWLRIYSPDKSVLLRDLVPVRIGSTGYMLDTLSGELFGNQGTGSFLLGPDL